MKIKNHKLRSDDGTQVKYVRTPNQSGIIKPTYLVLHYTAGRSAASAVRTLTSRKRKASAHFVIGRDGEVIQLAPCNRKVWHAGKSKWKDLVGMNAHSIGIELDNAGHLKMNGAGKWTAWFGREIPDAEVIVAKHKNGGKMTGWHSYTEKQMDALEEVAEALFEAYPLVDVIGHEDIAPRRKSDPGPAFAMASFRSGLIDRDDEEADWEDDAWDDVPDFLKHNPYR